MNPAYFLFSHFTLLLFGTLLSRFIALPDLNRFKLTKPLVLFISYHLTFRQKDVTPFSD